MNDDNPLWYDHAEPDEAPGPILLSLAAAFPAMAGAGALVRWIVWLPDRAWVASVMIAVNAAQKMRR